ncbi:helix-turn-helix domain-containing protein [Symbioplanes lichenis]|uniref:helix-turn-helix domain-containing protein n=1 Tax=Symbioplanes lichenis TaxID=1629072 RepID=UPI002738E608|nr:helix-turn-helix transcriptional regulator [Actinoplanes lichenis]
MSAQGESPAVARRRVRLALRKAREATGWSQGVVADRTGWSLSKVQRIEAGDVSVSGTDLRALLDLYGISDPEEIDLLLEEARISRRQRWWAGREYREHLTPAYSQLLQFEAEATAIRFYQPVLVPGILQVRSYAEFLISWFDKSLSDEDRRVRLDVRLQRRANVLDVEEGPQLLLILDESALKREIGGVRVMAEQLEDLAEVARRPQVNVRIVPLQEGAILGVIGSFQVLDLSDDPGDAVLYRERHIRDSLDHDRAEVQFHRSTFEDLWRLSLNEEKTIRAIEAEALSLRTRADRL